MLQKLEAGVYRVFYFKASKLHLHSALLNKRSKHETCLTSYSWEFLRVFPRLCCARTTVDDELPY